MRGQQSVVLSFLYNKKEELFMSITKEGDKWRCQLYFFDFKGQRHKTGKRGFKTKKEAAV